MIAEAWLAVAGVIAVATITPGPNNVIVLEAAVRGGVRAALPLIAAVIAGGLVLLALVWAGAGFAFEAVPRLRMVLTLAGSAWLAWLGAAMIVRSLAAPMASESTVTRLPRGWATVALFQLVNPKAWILMITATAAVGMHDRLTVAVLGSLFVLLSGAGLAIWTIGGSVLGAALARPRFRRRFEGLAGAMLIASAASLILP